MTSEDFCIIISDARCDQMPDSVLDFEFDSSTDHNCLSYTLLLTFL